VLALSPHNSIGIGDAENDHAFLAMSECRVAVADAIPRCASAPTTSRAGRARAA